MILNTLSFRFFWRLKNLIISANEPFNALEL
jgi:hypothetical protein